MHLAPFWLVHRIEECVERNARTHDRQGAGLPARGCGLTRVEADHRLASG
jgi:hypothetical protein